jgi:hypothetical protein
LSISEKKKFPLPESVIQFLPEIVSILVGEDEKKHQQGDGINKMKRRESLGSESGGSQFSPNRS